jgi:hypothetical protein
VELHVEGCGWQGGGCEGGERDGGVGFVSYGGEGAGVCSVDVLFGLVVERTEGPARVYYGFSSLLVLRTCTKRSNFTS